MTREEIEKDRQYQLTGAAIDYCRKEYPHYDGEALGEITDAFEAGAEWEHKRLVEKACEWLKENVSKYSYVIKVEDTEYRKVHFTDSLIEDFRKAMKEK